MKQFLVFSFILLLSATVIAQDNSCPVMQQAATSEARVWCSELEEGQACLGNSGTTAELLSDTSFSTPGDRVALSDVTRIVSETVENRYGVSLIHTTGYAPDNWLPQNVTLVILGDVTIANTGNEGINIQTVSAPVIGSQGANIRSGTSPEFRVITSVFEGAIVKLTGRLEGDGFYRVQVPSGEAGWIASGAIDIDVSELPVVTRVDSAPELIYAPFSSFSLTTGIEDAPCSGATESGVLIQSPLENPVRIRVNEQTLIFSGTLFLQAEEGRNLVHVIEGQLRFHEEEVVEGNTLAIFPDNSGASAYNIARFASLPTEILPRYTYIGIDLTTIITPAPSIDSSPIAGVLVDAPCIITTGESGANLRSGPGSDFPIRGVLAFRETVNPISRYVDSGGTVWFELAQNVWVIASVVVTGGDCVSVPLADRIPAPLPTPAPDS